MKNGASERSTGLLNLKNEFAENSILAGMIADSGLAVTYAEILSESHFAIPENKVTFLALVHLLMGTDPIDPISIAAAGVGIIKERNMKAPAFNVAYVKNLRVEFSSPENYIATLSKMKWLREMGEVAYWLVAEMQRDPNPTTLLDELQDKLKMIQAGSSSAGNIVYGWDTGVYHMNKLQARIDSYGTEQQVMFDFPWQSWNELIPPLSPGMVGAIYGPTKAGKSCYFEQIAEHWACKPNTHVFLVHLEDNLTYKLNRRSARWSKVDYKRILAGNLTEQEKALVAEAEDEIQSTFGPRLHYLHAPDYSSRDLCRTLRKEVDGGFCHAVVIDYLNKLRADSNQVKLFGSNVWDRQADDVETIKSFCESAGITCFTGGQEGQNGQDSTELDMKNIYGSSQIAHKVQALLMFGRARVGAKGLYNDKDEMIARPKSLSPFIDGAVMAQNQGEGGEFKQYINGKRFKIIDLPQNAMKRIELNEA